MGRTHGETVEQEWAYINLAALSTREMGPGARHTALDDSWGGWNWKKVLGMGAYGTMSYPRHNADILTAVILRFAIREEPLESSRNGIEAAPSRQ